MTTLNINVHEDQKTVFTSATYGDPDGEPKWVESLGKEVPTYVNPRLDLIPQESGNRFIRLDYHIPYGQRGIYKPEWLPEAYVESLGGLNSIAVDRDGYVVCAGVRRDATRKDMVGKPCAKRAVNRSGYCHNHGGALHPADKKISGQNVQPVPSDRIERLDRVQKFMQGFVSFDELSDEEVIGAFVFNDQGRPISSAKLGDKIHNGLTRELFRRMNRFMQMKLPNMLKRIADIADSDIVEPETQLKAAQWMAERVMGKTPEVLVVGRTDAPYESVLEQMEAGSREAHRNERRQLALEDDSLVIDPLGEIVQPESYGFSSVGSEGSGSGSGSGSGAGSDSGSGSDGDTGTDTDNDGFVLRHADDVSERVTDAKALRDRLKAARNKRYAARANGVSLESGLDQIPWLIEFKEIRDNKVIDEWGWCYRMKLVVPDAQTPGRVDRIMASRQGLGS